jgi:glucose-1-phosphate thymidylyltransferase
MKKGIILAGGKGTRLYPMTYTISKQLQPVYDKPMIYYPLSTLMLAGIRDILIISTPIDLPKYEALLGNGNNWGINIKYAEQSEPKGLPQAFTIGKDFIGNDDVCLILGDNLFYGKLDFLRNGLENNNGGTIFAYRVENPSDYGVVEFDRQGHVLSIEEKPVNPKSNYAIPGLYIFDSNAPEIASKLQPSKRGELEIVDMHKEYLNDRKLRVEQIGRGVAWLDTGTPDSLLDAGNFIHAIEKRQGRKIACLEEISLIMGFISKNEYISNIEKLPNCDYKIYCEKILTDF